MHCGQSLTVANWERVGRGRRTLDGRNRTGPKLTVEWANEVLVGDGEHGDASRCVVPLRWAAVLRLAVPALRR